MSTWHAVSVTEENTGRSSYGYGEFETKEEALETALDLCTEGEDHIETCFAMQDDPDFPTGEYAGLPEGLTASQLTFPQIAAIQRWCRGNLENVSVYRRPGLNLNRLVTLRMSIFEHGMWAHFCRDFLGDGTSRESSGVTVVTSTPHESLDRI